MKTSAPPRTFADLARAGLELEVTCQRCGHVAVVDDTAPRAAPPRLAGRRYRCARNAARSAYHSAGRFPLDDVVARQADRPRQCRPGCCWPIRKDGRRPGVVQASTGPLGVVAKGTWGEPFARRKH